MPASIQNPVYKRLGKPCIFNPLHNMNCYLLHNLLQELPLLPFAIVFWGAGVGHVSII